MPDHNPGRFTHRNPAEYHVPVNAGVRGIKVVSVDERDANAVRHATGRRIRELPITMDKVLGGKAVG